jgi:hypothetical protein
MRRGTFLAVCIAVVFLAFRVLSRHPNALQVPTDDRNTIVTAPNLKDVARTVATSTQFTAEEKELFATAVMNTSEGQLQKAGQPKTVAAMIAEERTRGANARAQREVDESNLKVLQGALTVVPKSIAVVDDAGQKLIKLQFVATNTSKTGIQNYSGWMRFTDDAGHRVDQVFLKIAEPLKPGQKRTMTHMEHRQESYLAGKTMKDLKAEWAPESIVFLNGERVAVSSGSEAE